MQPVMARVYFNATLPFDSRGGLSVAYIGVYGEHRSVSCEFNATQFVSLYEFQYIQKLEIGSFESNEPRKSATAGTKDGYC